MRYYESIEQKRNDSKQKTIKKFSNQRDEIMTSSGLPKIDLL
jgi:hypothetical protein